MDPIDDWKHGWDRPLFVDADDPAKFIRAGELIDMIKRIAYGLRNICGVKPGDVVLVIATNTYFTPAIILGVLAAGGILTRANPTFTDSGMYRDNSSNTYFPNGRFRACISDKRYGY